jgi:hypothetical protein
MCGLSASPLKDPIGGLKGGSLSRSPLSELHLGETLSYPPFNGW